ncbi:MAG: hypothetical protein MUD14_13470 [Hydrococcus sp. Prado102]|jgi:hypothetical protein|nr:hypothetical protein [Hydrococcus sp. Prado102]
MRSHINGISLIGTTLIGLASFTPLANSATIQTSTQIASIKGNNNRVTQVNNQTSLDLFVFDLDLNMNSDRADSNLIKSFLNAEILEFIDDFGENTSGIDQSISQSAQLLGKNNQITQISNQNIFDVFYLDPELNTAASNDSSSILPDFDLSRILGDRIINLLPDVNQSVRQEANILGNRNRVEQENNQTVIDFFLVDIKFSTKLDDIVIREVEGDWNDSRDFNLSEFIDGIETTIPFQNLPNSFFENNNPIIFQSSNSSINKIESVPEPSHIFSLLALGTIGLSSVIIRQKN